MSARLHYLHLGLLAAILLVASRMAPGVDLTNVLLWPAVGGALVFLCTALLLWERAGSTTRELALRILPPLLLLVAMLFTTRAMRLGGVIRDQQAETAVWQEAVDEGVASGTDDGRRVWLAMKRLPAADLHPLRIVMWIGAGLEGLIAVSFLVRRLGAGHA